MENYVALSLALATALLYLSGFGYVYGYYQYFQIGVNELSYGFQDVIVHSYISSLHALRKFFPFIILVAAAITLANSVIYEQMKEFRAVVTFVVLMLVLLAAVSSLFSADFGRAAAKRNAANLPRLTEINGFVKNIRQSFGIIGSKIDFFHIATHEDITFVLIKTKSGVGEGRWIARIRPDNTPQSIIYLDPA